jgi:hypothetical protein
MENKEINEIKEVPIKRGRKKGTTKTGGRKKGASIGPVSSLETLDGRIRWLCKLINDKDIEITSKLAAVRLLNELKGDKEGIQGLSKTILCIESINDRNKHIQELNQMKKEKLKELGMAVDAPESSTIEKEEKMIEDTEKQEKSIVEANNNEIIDDLDDIKSERSEEDKEKDFMELFKDNQDLELDDDF